MRRKTDLTDGNADSVKRTSSGDGTSVLRFRHYPTSVRNFESLRGRLSSGTGAAGRPNFARGSPALKDNQFCYYHQHCRPVTWTYSGSSYRNYSQAEFTLPVFEDAYALQMTLRQVVELVLQHRIDDKKAGLVLYALQIASSNLKRFEREQPKPEQVVTDAEIKRPVETPKEAEANRELQSDKIDTIHGSASETEFSPDGFVSVSEFPNLSEFLRRAVSSSSHEQAQRAVPPAARCRRRCG